MTINRSARSVVLVFFLIGLIGDVHAGFVRAEGAQIVDRDNRPFKLRGVLLEGWLFWHGLLWGGGFQSETEMTTALGDLAGREQARDFKRRVHDNFITERDIRLIARMGFNAVRVPFNFRMLEDDDRPYVYKEEGWEILDRLLAWCERHGVYVILDLHSAPGGQGRIFVADPGETLLWESEEKKRRTVALWKAIAARYRKREIIAGFDLLNEPHPPNGRALVRLYRRIISAIREVDRHHMVILEGSKFSTEFSFFPGRLTNNQSYCFHTYTFFPLPDKRKEHLEAIKRIAKKHDVPIWNCEFGANTADWIKETVELFEDPKNQVNGWIFWPWKRIPARNPRGYRHLVEVKPPRNWVKLAKKLKPPVWKRNPFRRKMSKQQVLRGMEDFLDAMRIENTRTDREIAKILTAFKKNAPDRDRRRGGQARRKNIERPHTTRNQ